MASITRTKTVPATPTITAGAYSANDAVGGLITFSSAAYATFGGGIIQTITIIDDAKQDAESELHLFNQTFTPTADNAAFNPSDDDMENWVGSLSVNPADYTDFVNNSGASVSNIGLAFNLVTTGQDLFGQLVTRGTPTYTATDDLTIKPTILQD